MVRSGIDYDQVAMQNLYTAHKMKSEKSATGLRKREITLREKIFEQQQEAIKKKKAEEQLVQQELVRILSAPDMSAQDRLTAILGIADFRNSAQGRQLISYALQSQFDTEPLAMEQIDRGLGDFLENYPQDTKRTWYDDTISPQNVQTAIDEYVRYLKANGLSENEARRRAESEYAQLRTGQGRFHKYPSLIKPEEQLIEGPPEPEKDKDLQDRIISEPTIEKAEIAPAPEFVEVWPKLDEETKKKVRLAMNNGYTPAEILEAIKEEK